MAFGSEAVFALDLCRLWRSRREARRGPLRNVNDVIELILARRMRKHPISTRRTALRSSGSTPSMMRSSAIAAAEPAISLRDMLALTFDCLINGWRAMWFLIQT